MTLYYSVNMILSKQAIQLTQYLYEQEENKTLVFRPTFKSSGNTVIVFRKNCKTSFSHKNTMVFISIFCNHILVAENQSRGSPHLPTAIGTGNYVAKWYSC